MRQCSKSKIGNQKDWLDAFVKAIPDSRDTTTYTAMRMQLSDTMDSIAFPGKCSGDSVKGRHRQTYKFSCVRSDSSNLQNSSFLSSLPKASRDESPTGNVSHDASMVISIL